MYFEWKEKCDRVDDIRKIVKCVAPNKEEKEKLIFRAIKGQHMSGIDVVLRQIVPGNDYQFPYMLSMPKLTDGEFYHYGLAKLGASAAHVDSNMKGRCMCEIFGASG